MKLFRSAKRVAVQEPEAAPVDAEQQGATPVAVPADGGMSGSLGIFAKLGDVLVQAGVVSAEQVDEALRAQKGSGKRLGQILIEQGVTSEEGIARALASQLNIPYMELGEEFRLSREEVKIVPESLARRYNLIPVKSSDEPILTVVMSDPIDLDAVSAIRSLTQLEIHKAVSTPRRIRKMIDIFYREEAHIESNLKDIIDLEDADEALPDGDPGVDADQLRVQANDAPVVRYVNLVLMEAVRDRASDIHFEPAELEISVRLRIDGVLRDATPPPHRLYQAVVTRIKILSGMNIAERRLPQDGRFKFKTEGRVVDVRVSALPLAFGEKIVLRILDRTTLIVDLGSVGLEGERLEKFERILHRPHGIILLTGPTGSGKTTTLYSALNHLKSVEKNIQTVEDPVEYLIPGINQMPIRPAIGLTFAEALRSILRQDPDIIMVGEIRDLDTARIAMRASLTGHLVFSTLHTNDSVSAFSRLHDIGVPPYLIASTVNLVIAQRLVRRICSRCVAPYSPSDEEMKLIEILSGGVVKGASYQKGAGCERCRHTGYRGRVAIIEFLEVLDPIRTAIINEEGDLVVRQRAMECGMLPLVLDAMEKVKQGTTTLDEVLGVLPEADAVRNNGEHS